MESRIARLATIAIGLVVVIGVGVFAVYNLQDEMLKEIVRSG